MTNLNEVGVQDIVPNVPGGDEPEPRLKERRSSIILRTLVSGTDSERIDRARNQLRRIFIRNIYQPTNKKFTTSKNMQDFDKKKPTTFQMTCRTDNNEYDPAIKFQDSVTPTSHVKVFCPCKDFLFRCAHVMWRNNAHLGNIKNKTKAPPVVTNPDMKQYICKHLISVVKALADSDLLR